MTALRPRPLHLLAGALLLMNPASGLAAGTVTCAPDRAIFVEPDGRRVTIDLEIADTEADRARGLMFRDSLVPGHGMLFIYETPQRVAFWMKNTLIPLDMLFIDATGRVAHVHAGAVPHDETPIPGEDPGEADPERLMVLEIGGGEAARQGLVEGTLMAHPRLPQTTAALPCE